MAESMFSVDHIGVRVADLDQAIADLGARFGFELESRELAPDGVTKVAFLRQGDTLFELFEVADAEPRVDHVGLRVDSVDEAMAALTPLLSSQDEWCRRVQGSRGGDALLIAARETAGVPMHLIAWP